MLATTLSVQASGCCCLVGCNGRHGSMRRLAASCILASVQAQQTGFNRQQPHLDGGGQRVVAGLQNNLRGKASMEGGWVGLGTDGGAGTLGSSCMPA